MEEWTTEQVAQFVGSSTDEYLQFGEKAQVYAEQLMTQDVDGQTLLGLSEEDLTGLGFSLGHRRKLLAWIQRWS